MWSALKYNIEYNLFWSGQNRAKFSYSLSWIATFAHSNAEHSL